MLSELAARAQPTSRLFLEALHSANGLDESEVLYWDNDPPYSLLEPSDTLEECRFTKNLADVMAGRQMQIENEAKRHRAQHYQVGKREELIVDVCEMVVETFRQWAQLRDVIGSCKLHRHVEMAQGLFQWRAKLVCSYLNEVQALEREKNPY